MSGGKRNGTMRVSAAALEALQACNERMREFEGRPIPHQQEVLEMISHDEDPERWFKTMTKSHEDQQQHLAAQMEVLRQQQREALDNYEKRVRECLAPIRTLCALLPALGAQLWHLVNSETPSRCNWCAAAGPPTWEYASACTDFAASS
jgi:hypothetical protein